MSDDGWMPIETAPKTGEEIQVAMPTNYGWRIDIARWCLDKFSKKPRPYWVTNHWSDRTSYDRAQQPTHWRPMPAPPAEGE